MSDRPVDGLIYDGVRTPFGRHAGALATVRPDDLMAHAIRVLAARGPFREAGYRGRHRRVHQPGGGRQPQRGATRSASGRAAGGGGRHYGQPVVRERPRRAGRRGARCVLPAGRTVHSGRSGEHEPRPDRDGEGPSGRSAARSVCSTRLSARVSRTRARPCCTGITRWRRRPRSWAATSASRARRAIASPPFRRRDTNGRGPPATGRTSCARSKSPTRGSPGRRSPTTSIPVRVPPSRGWLGCRRSSREGQVTAGNASGINDGAAALYVGSMRAGETGGCGAEGEDRLRRRGRRGTARDGAGAPCRHPGRPSSARA